MKYKVGQKVRIKDTPNVRRWKGEQAINKEDIIYATTSCFYLLKHNITINFTEDDLELIEDSPVSFKFEIGQEVKEIEGGNYFCNPKSFIEAKYSIGGKNYRTNTSEGVRGLVTKRVREAGTNWYTFSEYENWITEEGIELVQEEVKFIPDKWYRFTEKSLDGIYYAKYSKNQDVKDRFYHDEMIDNTKYKKRHDWSALSCLPVLLENLDEIQEYLPIRHPDKVKELWFIQYDPEITEDEFDRLRIFLNNTYSKEFVHCNFSISFSEFKRCSFIRTAIKGEQKEGWCIDNNPQGINTEKTIYAFIPKSSLKLEKGKWYKTIGEQFTKNKYIKFYDYVDGMIRFSEKVTQNNEYHILKHSESWSDDCKTSIKNPAISLKEVPEFEILPYMKQDYIFKQDDIVVIQKQYSGSQGWWKENHIYKCTGADTTTRFIKVNKQTNGFTTANMKDLLNIRLATEEEVKAYNSGYETLEEYKNSKLLDLKNTKIWIGNNEELCKKVFNRLKELGCDKGNIWKTYKQSSQVPYSFYIDNSLYLSWSDEDNRHNRFNHNKSYKEIKPEDIGIFIEKSKSEKKWQIGGYVRLLHDYYEAKTGDIAVIKRYASKDLLIVEFNDEELGSGLYTGEGTEKAECEWVGMVPPSNCVIRSHPIHENLIIGSRLPQSTDTYNDVLYHISEKINTFDEIINSKTKNPFSEDQFLAKPFNQKLELPLKSKQQTKINIKF